MRIIISLPGPLISMGLSISNIFSINLNYINYETVCMLLILPIMFLILCSDDTVEEIGGSNHVLSERYLQEVLNISMDNLERVRLVVQELVLSHYLLSVQYREPL